MTYGLRVRNAAGAITLDVGSSLARHVGSATLVIAANVSSGSISVPNLLSTDDLIIDYTSANGISAFTVSVSGTTVTITKVPGFTSETVTYYIKAFRLA